MRFQSLAAALPRLLLCVFVVTTVGKPVLAAGPRGGFLGSILRLDDDDADKPKPPVPTLGKMIYPVDVRRPLPTPIPAPDVPVLESIKRETPRTHKKAISEKSTQTTLLNAPTNSRSGTADSLASNPAEPEETAAEEPQPASSLNAPLSTQMLQLRDAIRSTTDRYNQPLNTQTATPGDVLQACFAFGSTAEVLGDQRSNKRINAIGAICWNVPFAGKTLLVASDGSIMPRIGYGYQSQRGELLATLAMASVSRENEIRVDQSRSTVDDLIRWEQSSIRSGTDLSMTLIGLTYYLDADATWTNTSGETWTLDRVAGEELSRDVAITDVAAVDRLMGLSAYVVWARKNDIPRTGRHLQVEQYVARFHEHALDLQSPAGTWGPHYFGYPGSGGIDNRESLYSTGNILLWLTMSLSTEQLQIPELVRAVARVTNGLAAELRRESINSWSPRELSMAMRCVRAISQYDLRVFEGE